MAEDSFSNALKSNASWAGYKQHSSPEYFEKFKAGQTPTILWLGCSDSRVPETTLLGLQPGEVFVHRNIANIITTSDLNVLAVIEYAVVHLKVKHVVLCGHTSCGGAAAAMSDDKVGGVLDAWLTPLRIVRKREWKRQLEHIKDDKERAVKLAELNVEEGVSHLMANSVVEDAIRERGLKVHGCLYDIGSGLLRELGFGTEEATNPNEHGIDELTPEELGIRNGVAGHESSKDVKPTAEESKPVVATDEKPAEKLEESTPVAAATTETTSAPVPESTEPSVTKTEAQEPSQTQVKDSESKDVATKVKEALVDIKDTVAEKTA